MWARSTLLSGKDGKWDLIEIAAKIQNRFRIWLRFPPAVPPRLPQGAVRNTVKYCCWRERNTAVKQRKILFINWDKYSHRGVSDWHYNFAHDSQLLLLDGVLFGLIEHLTLTVSHYYINTRDYGKSVFSVIAVSRFALNYWCNLLSGVSRFLTSLKFLSKNEDVFKCRSLFTPGGHRLWAFHHIWCRIFDIDWLAFANIARYRTFGLFMLGRGMNGPIFQPRLNSAFSRGAVYYFEFPPSPTICLQLHFNLDQQSLKAETFSIKEFYSRFSRHV